MKTTLTIANVVKSEDATSVELVYAPSNKKFIKFFKESMITQKLLKIDINKSIKKMFGGKVSYKVSKENSKRMIGEFILNHIDDSAVIDEFYLMYDNDGYLVPLTGMTEEFIEPILVVRMLKSHMDLQETKKTSEILNYCNGRNYDVEIDDSAISDIGIDDNGCCIIYTLKQLKKLFKKSNISDDFKKDILANFEETKNFITVY